MQPVFGEVNQVDRFFLFSPFSQIAEGWGSLHHLHGNKYLQQMQTEN